MDLLRFRTWRKVVYVVTVSLLMVACSDNNGDDIPDFGDKDVQVTADAYQITALQSPYEAGETAEFLWKVESASTDVYSLTDGTTENAQFIAMPGTYKLLLQVSEKGITGTATVNVTVKEPAETPRAHITKVYDYLPAIGQFVNTLPAYEEGDTQEAMNRKCEEAIAKEKPSMIHLGGFGGYVVFGFDHTIINVDGRCDLRILGNAFGAAANPDPGALFGGSCEPGVIMVAYDKNNNGKPDDDEWYEIAGSSHQNPKDELWYAKLKDGGFDVETIFNYEITYYRPETEEPDGTSSGHITIADYVRWEDNQGNSGYKVKNSFHNQSYYPAWVKGDKITFKGTRLPENGIDESGAGSYFVLYGFNYGYADNYPNTHDKSAIDLNCAVDSEGNSVHLPGVDFVKVYTGVNQENGWLGECSTEVAGAEDLHLKGVVIRN